MSEIKRQLPTFFHVSFKELLKAEYGQRVLEIGMLEPTLIAPGLEAEVFETTGGRVGFNVPLGCSFELHTVQVLAGPSGVAHGFQFIQGAIWLGLTDSPTTPVRPTLLFPGSTSFGIALRTSAPFQIAFEAIYYIGWNSTLRLP